MSKRTLDPEAAQSPVSSKKQRKEESKSAVVPDAKKLKAEKKEKRKEKKGKKRSKEENGIAEPATEIVETTEEKKERRRLKKAAKARTNGTNGTNGITKSSDSEPVVKDSLAQSTNPTSQASSATSPEPVAAKQAQSGKPGKYTPKPALSSLPQSKVDEYLNSNEIKIIDSISSQQALRPITEFSYIPESQTYGKFFEQFSNPTPIQAATWPYLFNGRDVIGVAETGSGKTLAFGVPCIQKIVGSSSKKQKGIKAAIVSPTRELACQIYEQLEKLAEPAGLRVVCVYGGVPKDDQRAQLQRAHIVVATPGRLNDFISEGAADLSGVEFACLDEADRMLDKGFEEDIRKILSACSAADKRQTVMFTATWPQSVRDLASTFMTTPVQIYIGGNPKGELQANTRIEQVVEVMDPKAKDGRLVQILRTYQNKNKKDRILIFCLYKKEATRVENFIRNKGFKVAGIHGDLSQQKRTASLELFKKGEVPLLVATDVAARGLDIPAVKLVLNVTFPLTAEDYVHRIGRTGRAGQTGKSITFFTEHEKHLSGALISVLKSAGQPVPEDLLKFGTTVKKKEHSAYGAFFKEVDTTKKASKITFD